jgi:RNA polymerase sigma-70 factor (ECF subfamily)
MSAVRAGQTDFLGVLFERYSREAFGLCRRMVGDAASADDLVQESFLRVLRYRGSYSAGARFAPWLFRIVRNVCLDHIAARQRESAVYEQAASEHPERRFVAPHEPDPERVDQLKRALGRLSPEQRSVLLLKRVDGLSYAQIAERLGTTEGAERVRAHRALRRLRTIIQTFEAAANEV